MKGLLLLNLERMRAFNWSDVWNKKVKEHRIYLSMGDQDVHNLMVKLYPRVHYMLHPGWNVQLFPVAKKRVKPNEMYLLHGLANKHATTIFKWLFNLFSDDLQQHLLDGPDRCRLVLIELRNKAPQLAAKLHDYIRLQ